MYGGGPVIIREAIDIYSKDLAKELSASKLSSLKQKQASDKISNNNIFKKKESIAVPDRNNSPEEAAQVQRQGSRANNKAKKRNLFLSENAKFDEEDCIPEEQMEESKMEAKMRAIRPNRPKNGLMEKVEGRSQLA